jgi:hypothetical protein
MPGMLGCSDPGDSVPSTRTENAESDPIEGASMILIYGIVIAWVSLWFIVLSICAIAYVKTAIQNALKA